jgi:hypothetical protein
VSVNKGMWATVHEVVVSVNGGTWATTCEVAVSADECMQVRVWVVEGAGR